MSGYGNIYRKKNNFKIVTWNINGYRSITGQNPSKRYDVITNDNKLFAYISSEQPDLLCCQEVRADIEQIDEDKRCPPGYFAYYNPCRSKKGYSGVVTFSKVEPKNVNYNFGTERFDIEGRFVELEFKDFILMNSYFPKGETESERLTYKLDFYDALFEYAGKLHDKGKKLIISGDYNTAHKEIDLARPKENIKISGFLPIERVKLDWMVENGYVDSFRHFCPDPGHYTWWSQRGQARANNIGWRIDYHFVSEGLVPKLKTSYIQPQTPGSDHVPLVLELK